MNSSDRLSGVTPGLLRRVAGVEGNGVVAQRLMAMGFVTGSTVRVVGRAPFGDPIAVELNGWRLCMRCSEASRILLDGEA